MTPRQIARELAVIVFPQLPKDKKKLEKTELDFIVSKATAMLTDYAKQCLADADSLTQNIEKQVIDAEIEHPNNAETADELVSVPVTTRQIREVLELVQRSVGMVSEALDIPVMVNRHAPEVSSFLHTLVETYVEHREEIDNFIREASNKWKVERMVSIDRDILRLACAEAFFLPDVPIKVAINEAVELSKRFADEKAAKFINGVLHDLAEEAEKFRATTRSGLKEAADKVGKWTIK
jgi:N utilization substance protein B